MKSIQEKLLSEARSLKLHPYHDELLPLEISEADVSCLNETYRKICALCPKFHEAKYLPYSDTEVKILAKMLWHQPLSEGKYIESLIVFRDPTESKHVGVLDTVLYEADLIRTFPNGSKIVKHACSSSFSELCDKVFAKAQKVFKLGGNA